MDALFTKGPSHPRRHVCHTDARSCPLIALRRPQRHSTDGRQLSDRQAACLRWSAAGKTSWETARILGVSESTVNFHLRNACTRLGVRGRRAAVVTALRLGLLEFKA